MNDLPPKKRTLGFEDESWVFAYGSNMDLPDLARWLHENEMPILEPSAVRTATLPSHRLVWNYRSVARRGGAANIEPAPSGLPGIILRADQALLEAIDLKEGPSYARQEYEVSTSSGTVTAWAYRVVPARRAPAPVLPRQAYLQLMLRAAVAHRLPAAHIAALRATPTFD